MTAIHHNHSKPRSNHTSPLNANHSKPHSNRISPLNANHFKPRSNHTSPLNANNECKIRRVKGSLGKASVAILGGMSQVGMHLALSLISGSGSLNDSHTVVTVLEDLLNVDSDTMKWDRWSKLINAKHIDASIIEFKDENRLQQLLSKAAPSAIVYVPTLLLHPVTSGPGSLTHTASYGTVVIKEFLHVIEVARKHFNAVKFVLLSSNVKGSKDSIHKQWLQSLENIFSAYRHLHPEFSASIVKLPSYFGEWQDLRPSSVPTKSHQWYIKDVTKALEVIIMNKDNNCTFYSFNSPSLLSLKRTTFDNALAITRKWEGDYSKGYKTSRNVTIGAYFVQMSHNYYHRKALGNKFSYLSKWMKSSQRFGLQNIVFHDTLDPMFVGRIVQNFNNPRPIFLKVKPRNNKSPNDQRFYFVYDYLLKHSDVNMVMVNDVKDVEFLTNPALIMKAIGDYFYIGKDVGFILYTDWIQRRDFQQCYRNGNDWKIEESMRLFGFLNVGVLGGTRASMLASLAYFVHCLDRTSTDRCCCDMSISQYIYHAIFFDQLFSGYPFNMAFKTASPGPFGMAAKHKATYDDI